MPKMKSRKSYLKRIKITKNGKLLRRKSFGRHLKSTKTKKQLRSLRRIVEIKGFYAKKIRKGLGLKNKK